MRFSWFLSAGLAMFATAIVSPPSSLAQGTQKPLVVVITVDGFPARALENPRLPMPHLRELIRHGVSAKGMIPINPSVTWPNHTTLITGVNASEHHVMANGLIVFPHGNGAPKVKPWVDKDHLVHAETLYDAAAQKGMTTGQVDWVAIYGAKNVRWQFGEKPNPQGPIPQELVRDGALTKDQLEHFGEATPAWHDQIWTDAAVDILEHHTPSLMLIHLLETDSIQHQYGAMSTAAYAAYAYADDCIGRIEDAVKSAGAWGRTTFFIMSDHGFTTYSHTIRPNAQLRLDGFITGSGDAATGKVWTQAEGGAAEVFILDDASRAAITETLKRQFAAIPGVEGVYTNSQAQSMGIPALGTTSQAPDLYLTAAPGYAFSGEAQGAVSADIDPARGTHGYDNRDPEMQALFVASGAHIRPGITLPVFPNLRVAPTIAKVLGVTLPAAKQPPLDILR